MTGTLCQFWTGVPTGLKYCTIFSKAPSDPTMATIVSEYVSTMAAVVAVIGGSVATGTGVSVGGCVGVVVAVGATVEVSINGVFTIANGVCVETGICVAWASNEAALQAIKRSEDITNKALFTVNMASSFQDYSTIT